jgi:hypothetical protein
MALISKESVDKAKALAEKNKAKLASGVSKATETIDKKTGGKHTDKLKKVDEVAKKYAGQPGEAAVDDAPADDALADDATEAATESPADAESSSD